MLCTGEFVQRGAVPRRPDLRRRCRAVGSESTTTSLLGPGRILNDITQADLNRAGAGAAHERMRADAVQAHYAWIVFDFGGRVLDSSPF